MPLSFARSILAGGLAEPTYELTRSATSINEGQSVTFTLNTTNIPDSTNIPYSISGVSSADINGASLSGNFNINNNTGSLTFYATNDATTEGFETLTLNLTNGSASTSCGINDTSRNPTYSVSRSSSTVSEGDSLTFYLNTTNVSNGTNVPYTLSGTNITSADINGAPLTGSLTVNNNSASLTVTISEDYNTEGTETIYITVNGATIGSSILDTSKADHFIVHGVRVGTDTQGIGSFYGSWNTDIFPNGNNLQYALDPHIRNTAHSQASADNLFEALSWARGNSFYKANPPLGYRSLAFYMGNTMVASFDHNIDENGYQIDQHIHLNQSPPAGLSTTYSYETVRYRHHTSYNVQNIFGSWSWTYDRIQFFSGAVGSGYRGIWYNTDGTLP